MMPPAFKALIERYCQLGRLLPPADALDLADPGSRAEVEVVLREMAQVERRIDAMLGRAATAAGRSRKSPH
jgi:hypothetical protein